MNQELVQALDELVAARKMAPSRRHSLIVAAQQIVGRFGRAPFSIGRSRQAVGNVIAELLEHVCPLIQAGAQPVSRPASPAVNGVAPCSDGASCALPPCLGEHFFWQSAVIYSEQRTAGGRWGVSAVVHPGSRAEQASEEGSILSVFADIVSVLVRGEVESSILSGSASNLNIPGLFDLPHWYQAAGSPMPITMGLLRNERGAYDGRKKVPNEILRQMRARRLRPCG